MLPLPPLLPSCCTSTGAPYSTPDLDTLYHTTWLYDTYLQDPSALVRERIKTQQLTSALVRPLWISRDDRDDLQFWSEYGRGDVGERNDDRGGVIGVDISVGTHIC